MRISPCGTGLASRNADSGPATMSMLSMLPISCLITALFGSAVFTPSTRKE